MVKTAPTRRLRSAVLAGAAVAVLLVYPALPASAADALPPKDPTPTKSGQGVPDSADSFQAMKSLIGIEAMKNQDDLNAFKSWLITQPGVSSDGFYDSAVDLSTRTMTLQWHGTTALQARAVAEGTRRGLKIAVKRVAYTRESVDQAMRLLMDPANAAKLRGFHVTSVAGPTVENDNLTVAVTTASKAIPNTVSLAGVVPALMAAAKSLTGLDATFVPGRESIPYTTRSTDVTPFNAGGMIRGSNGSGCTSGFAIRRSGFTWTTTARHCNAASWTAWDRPSSSYGNAYSTDSSGGRMLTGDGFYWMFDGAWNNSSGYHKTVWGMADVSQGSSICSSGANSGVHCGLVVENMNEIFNDGYGSFSTIRVHARSGIAGAHGDSGGPMLIPASDGTHVWAVGMLQGSNQTQTSSCGSLRISTTCSAWVEFTPQRTFLNNMGATLVTG